MHPRTPSPEDYSDVIGVLPDFNLRQTRKVSNFAWAAFSSPWKHQQGGRSIARSPTPIKSSPIAGSTRLKAGSMSRSQSASPFFKSSGEIDSRGEWISPLHHQTSHCSYRSQGNGIALSTNPSNKTPKTDLDCAQWPTSECTDPVDNKSTKYKAMAGNTLWVEMPIPCKAPDRFTRSISRVLHSANLNQRDGSMVASPVICRAWLTNSGHYPP
jgi:hypothetical protein